MKHFGSDTTKSKKLMWAVSFPNEVIWQIDRNGKEAKFGDLDLAEATFAGWYNNDVYYEVRLQEGDIPVLLRRHQVDAKTGKDDIIQYILGIKGKFEMLIDVKGNVEVNCGPNLSSNSSG